MKRSMRRIAPILGALLIVLSLSARALAADKYVALGDSYSAGNGANSTNLNSSCNRNTYAYPYLLSQQKGYALTFVACAGAVTGDIINNQVNSVTSDTKLVTITIGGNDIGFTNLILACTTLGCASQIATSQSQDQRRAAGQARTDLRGDQGQGADREGRRARLRPPVRQPAEDVPGGDRRVVLGGDVADGARRQPQQHDQGARPGRRLHYADVNPYWAGHDVCASNPFTNGLTLLHTADSYHPTRNGYANGDVPAIRAIIG